MRHAEHGIKRQLPLRRISQQDRRRLFLRQPRHVIAHCRFRLQRRPIATRLLALQRWAMQTYPFACIRRFFDLELLGFEPPDDLEPSLLRFR